MSDITTDLPAMTDDSGTGRDGTVEDVAFFETWRDAINNQVLSATNPTVTPADTIDEVVAARGTLPSLSDWTLVEHNADGTHQALSYVTSAQMMGGLGGVNLIRNDDFQLWPDGDASAPLYWPVTGSGASAARTGTGLGDTTRKVGDFSCKLTRSGADCYIQNALLSGGAFTRANFLRGKFVAAGMWVYCSTPNIARIAVNDGIGTTYSTYHTGAGAWEFLAATRELDSSATAISIRGAVNTSDGSAYFSGACAILIDSDLALRQYQPSPISYGMLHYALAGNLSAAANQGRVTMSRGALVKDVQAIVKTAPTTQAIIFDVNSWDGASYTSMFSTQPQIAAAAYYGGAQPDGTYARRCLRGAFGSSISAGAVVTLDVDQVGSGTTGADAAVEVRVLQYMTPLERFLSYND